MKYLIDFPLVTHISNTFEPTFEMIKHGNTDLINFIFIEIFRKMEKLRFVTSLDADVQAEYNKCTSRG
ncbi:hypothetical protein ACF0H5_001644 [Mactra antiquata]